MSKKSKSKNSVIKRAKKFQRQGKYKRVLEVCDDFLDGEIEENVLRIKIDVLMEQYHNEKFEEKLNEYKMSLSGCLSENEREELLKIYNLIDNYLDLHKDNLVDKSIVKKCLSGGLLNDNIEIILTLNEIIRERRENNLNKVEEVPEDLREYVEKIKKGAYQFLELIMVNPKETIKNSKFNMKKILEKIRSIIPPEEFIKEYNNNSSGDSEKSDMEGNESEKDVYGVNGESENTLKMRDETEPIKKELELKYKDIDELKEEINELNRNNRFKKALKLQKKLVKIGESENIITSEIKEGSPQKTLYDF